MQYYAKILILVVFCFVTPTMSFAEEFMCTCKKYNSYTTSIKGAKSENTEANKCKNTMSRILEQEEGFLALSLTDGSKYRAYDVKKETKSLVQAERVTDKDNFVKINFNKNSKTLRLRYQIVTELKAIWDGNNQIAEYSYLKIESNLNLSCKKI